MTQMERDIEAGLKRLNAIEKQLENELLEEVKNLKHAKIASQQPWIIFGCSDGIGLQTTVAALKAGVLKHGLGVYWEPPHFLETDDAGNPTSPVHYARQQNALALSEFAKKFGASFEVLYANCMIAPKRGLKGEIKEPPNELAPEIIKEINKLRDTTSNKDVVLINSVAFGKWMCPREGQDPIEVPSVDFDGRIVSTKTKPFHARGYQETLDTMGRNHGELLQTAKKLRWLGPDSLTAFYTWAGGSQNVDVLEGIYGKGALGDAKAIAERDTVAFRLEHGMELGSHAVVRLPAFLSAALMGIPGGGLFGLISRYYLSKYGCFFDMPSLASRTIRRLFGDEWIRENPIAQIELDMQETLHIEGIKKEVAKANNIINEYYVSKNHDRNEPIPLEDSKYLLKPFVGEHYVELLERFRPKLDGSNAHTFSNENREKDIVASANNNEDFKISRAVVKNIASGKTFGNLNEIHDKPSFLRYQDFSEQKISPDIEDNTIFAGTAVRAGKVGHRAFVAHYNDRGRGLHVSDGKPGTILPDIPLVESIRFLHATAKLNLNEFSITSDEVDVVDDLTGDLFTTYTISTVNGRTIVDRTTENSVGDLCVRGRTELVQKDGSGVPQLSVGSDLGKEIGHAMPVRHALESIYGLSYDADKFNRAALMKFVAEPISNFGGIVDNPKRFNFGVKFGSVIKIGDILRTFIRREENVLYVTVLKSDDSLAMVGELRQ